MTKLRLLTLCCLALAGFVWSCSKKVEGPRPLMVSAIPDQDPEKLQRLYGSLSKYLSDAVGSEVVYKPVTDYKAAVTAFRIGDLDLVWFGGLTGVQARLQVPGAEAIVQRDVDQDFRSVFIANRKSGVRDLSDLKGKSFTFGSESSTSGRLMPQFFLEKAGVNLDDFKGNPAFSGSHDKTIALVAAGAFDAGVLNAQVWAQRLAEGTADTSRVEVFFTTPPYRDYHWVLHPEAEGRMGPGLKSSLVAAFTNLTQTNPGQGEILSMFGARRFIETTNANYSEIEQVGKKVGLIRSDESLHE